MSESSASSPDPVPQRIGDAERDQAATYLREALAQGRLDEDEFGERLDQALRAKTMADLDPLFHDLPGPKPGQALAPAAGFEAPPWQREPRPPGSEVSYPTAPNQVAAPGQANKALTIAAAVAWPLTIMACFIVGWQYWWLIFIPITISSIAGQRHQHGHRNRHGS